MVGISGAPLPDGIGPAARRLAQELRALKDARGLTLAQLGAQTHYSRASWERWLNGKRLITSDALGALAARYGVDVAPLLALLQQARTEDGIPGSGDGVAGGAGGAGEESADAAETGTAVAGSAAARLPWSAVGRARIAQLPPTTSDFTGRLEQVTRLRAALTPGTGDPGQVSIAAVTGGGGLGKTTLAVHVAHLVAAQFPDGQLYVDLLGACNSQARTPEDVLEEWLRALGEDPATLPPRLEQRAALLRSLLSGTRMLLLLDNARDVEQIRPLLPAANTCAVLITSRNRMAELPGAYKLGLESLPDGEAWTLLAQLAGAGRLAAEPDASGALLRACGGIPLALRIAGARLAARANWRVSTLANRLGDERRRLDELEIGDLAARASFRVSYAALAKSEGEVPSAARAFRLLGLAAGPDISLPAAAALLGVSTRRAETVLESLVDGHLLESPTPDRYRMHDLVRLYAAEQVRLDEDEPERRAAVARLTGWYLATAAHANAWLAPQARPVPLEPIASSSPAIEFATHERALAWCDLERANLSAAVQSCAEHGCREYAWKLAAALLGFFNLRRHLADWTATHQTGLAAAEAAGDRVGEAWMHNNLGFVYFYWEESDRKALNCFERSLAIRIELDDLTGQAIALNNMGGAHHRLGDPDEGMRCMERATRIREQLGDRLGVGMSCLNIGCIYLGTDRPESAEPYLHRALTIVEELGNRQLTVTTLNNLGEVYIKLQDQESAKRYLKRSLILGRELGDVPGQAQALQSLAKAHYDAGEGDVALPLWHQSLELYESVSDPVAEEVRAELAEAGFGGTR
jgi:tetratricopeptide (TPR) repeat protein/transcriptional regulator with XRE-family HTH domain